MRKIHAAMLCVSALILVGGCAARPVSLAEVPAQPDATADGDLRVMSFNLRVRTMLDVINPWRARRDGVAALVRDFQPDVLATQEGLMDQVDDLKQRLPGYGFVGVGRNDGARRGETVAIFYREHRFRAADSGHFWLSETPDVPSRGFGAWWTRMVTWVRLEPRHGGDAFYVFNTHFDVASARARMASAALLNERIATIAGGAPVLVAGDFNDAIDSVPYQKLTGGGLVDTFRLVHPDASEDIGTRHGFRGGTQGERIDWVLASEHFQPIDAGIDRRRPTGRLPSDHFPVTAVLNFHRPATVATDDDALPPTP